MVETPAQVMARKQTEQVVMIGVGVAFAAVFAGMVASFVREMRRAVARRDRVRQPWETG